jgi:PAS domain S-box-containing protein
LTDETVKEYEQRLADIIDFLPDATFAIDRAGKVIIWNRAIEEMTGVKAEDILGKGNYEYAIPFYGGRRPILVDLLFRPDRKLEGDYYSYVRRENGLVVCETNFIPMRTKHVFLWGKASPLYDSKVKVIGAIESIRDVTERKQAELALKERELDLKAKTHELEDLNAALRVLLKQRDQDRSVLEEKVLSNIKVLILPHLEKLKGQVDGEFRYCVNVLESNLKDIVSPFARKLSLRYLNLTNREVQIANFIKEGMSTKEIAKFLNVSEAAVNIHRHRIRHKLNLTKTHNLRSYLSSLS